MHRQIAIALAAPVFDPETQMAAKFFWRVEPDLSVGLTANIGME